MTPEQSYKKYYCYCMDDEVWSYEFVQKNLKRTGIDYERFSFKEFKDKILTDDSFNERWGNGCREELKNK